MVRLGSDALLASTRLRGLRAGIVCNPASVNREFTHIVDRLGHDDSVRLAAIFGPQHGFRSDVQDNMVETPHLDDPARRVPVYSLYSETREPTADMLRDLDLPPLGGDSNRAGPVLTKTLLIYALTAGGTNDGPRLVALDKRTGEEIASVDLPGGAIGTPMTYMVDGRQYVALTVGGSSVPELITLTLPVAEGSSRNK